MRDIVGITSKFREYMAPPRSSPKGNGRSSERKSSKYFEYFSNKRFFFSIGQGQLTSQCPWLEPAEFQTNLRLYEVLVTCKNEEDLIKNEGARVLTNL